MLGLCFFFSVKCNLDENTVQSNNDFKNDLDEISRVKKRSKIVACLSIIRNSLADGNQEVKAAIDNSKFDRSKSFDKIVVIMLNNCENKISDSEMEKILMPENILTMTPISLNLIKFDKDLLTTGITFNEVELELLKEINEASQLISNDSTVQDEEIGFMGFKLSQLGNSQYIFVFFLIGLIFVIIFGGFYMLKCKKKDVKKNKSKKN